MKIQVRKVEQTRLTSDVESENIIDWCYCDS